MSDRRQGSGPRWRWPAGERSDPRVGAELVRAFHELVAKKGAAALAERLPRLSERHADVLRRRWLTNEPELLDRVALDYDTTPRELQRTERQALRRLGAKLSAQTKRSS